MGNIQYSNTTRPSEEAIRVEKHSDGLGYTIYVGAKKKDVETWTDVLIFLSALNRDDRRI